MRSAAGAAGERVDGGRAGEVRRMVRRYADPVQVRRGDESCPGAGDGAPVTFLWRGRLYVVRGVLGHWWERRAWWTAAPAGSVHGWGPAGEVPVREDAGGEGGEGAGDGAGDDAGGEVPDRPGTAPSGAARPGEWGSDREVWRVEASPGRAFGTGVYDLGCPGDDAWLLLRVAD